MVIRAPGSLAFALGLDRHDRVTSFCRTRRRLREPAGFYFQEDARHRAASVRDEWMPLFRRRFAGR